MGDVLMEEFHLTLTAPAGLPEAEYEAMRRAIGSKRFRRRLARAATAALRRERPLAKAAVKLSR